MKEHRSASQILFNFLPEQTADLRGGIWKVKVWRNPIKLTNIDSQALKNELIRLASPWRAADLDGGFADDLQRGRDIEVLLLDKSNGVQVEQFPKTWMCKKCHRILKSPKASCKCGYERYPGQLPFVGYHDRCGAIKNPYIPRCSQHDDVKVIFPGTTASREILFVCPECNKILQKGFGFARCHCGQGTLTFMVHRASSVYTPRTAVLVNPPSNEKMRAITEAGGAAKALSWVVNGMETRSVSEAPATRESLRHTLENQGLPSGVIERMLDQITEEGSSTEEFNFGGVLNQGQLETAESQAFSIALATMSSRLTLEDLKSSTDPVSDLGVLYRDLYPLSFDKAGIQAVELLDKFPVLTGNFGYTRGDTSPGNSRLVPFRQRSGAYAIYSDVTETEALFIRLDSIKVCSWLRNLGHDIAAATSQKEARIEILKKAVIPQVFTDTPPRTIGSDLLILVHSYAHKFLRAAAVFAGVDQNSLCELLMPSHLGFFIYAAARGDFVLGGLQALFEGELNKLLDEIVKGEYRCPLDPGCLKAGGACMACLHVGEPSCRLFNTNLNRAYLKGPKGFLIN